jgi:tetratricopeptide (TPR) repeat protein
MPALSLRHPIPAASALALACLLAACGHQRLVYAPDELRRELRDRAPELSESDAQAPFEVDDATRLRAERSIAGFASTGEQVRALVKLMFDRRGFALQYAPTVTANARDTLRAGRGNCLSLAFVFVGLARAAGLSAHFIDASSRVTETLDAGPDLVVQSGHITALLELGQTRFYFDVQQSIGLVHSYRMIDDLEAVANLFNNRAFEAIEDARAAGRPIDWAAAARDFALATKVSPAFSRAYNNLGLARVRLGDLAGAEAAYRLATHLDPASGAPLNNLGTLYLDEGRLQDALAALRSAVALEPKSAHKQFNLGRAQLLSGDWAGAQASLERAAQLRHEGASRMLGKLQLYVQ